MVKLAIIVYSEGVERFIYVSIMYLERSYIERIENTENLIDFFYNISKTSF